MGIGQNVLKPSPIAYYRGKICLLINDYTHSQTPAQLLALCLERAAYVKSHSTH